MPMPSDRNPVADTAQAREIDVKLDADKAKLWFDDLALDRIIAAVGESPAKPDRDTLRRDLLTCNGQYGIKSGPGQAGFVKRQRDRLNSIRKHARHLVELLKDDAADLGFITMIWPINNPDHPAHPFTQMVLLVEMIDRIALLQGTPRDHAERASAHLGASGSALQWLAGFLLPSVYTKHFGKKAKKSRRLDDGSLDGPYIRFARQVLAELEIGCSDETIAGALRLARGKNPKK
jgi:hypothetical protein